MYQYIVVIGNVSILLYKTRHHIMICGCSKTMLWQPNDRYPCELTNYLSKGQEMHRHSLHEMNKV